MEMPTPSDPPKRIKSGYGSRSSDSEIDRRIGQAMDVLARKPTIRRSELHRIFAQDPKTRWVDKAGEPVVWQTVDRIVRRARQEILDRATRPKHDIIADIVAGYERDQADGKASVRMAARQGIRELLGLDAPRKTEITGADGAQLPAMVVQVVGTVVVPEPKQVQGNDPLQIEVANDSKT